jgi:hypothetical protein
MSTSELILRAVGVCLAVCATAPTIAFAVWVLGYPHRKLYDHVMCVCIWASLLAACLTVDLAVLLLWVD